MIKPARGSIFEGHYEALVNPVNTRGTMGAGLARVFRSKYPEMYERYKATCDAGLLQIGDLYLFKVPPPIWYDQPRWIINVPTKEDPKLLSKLEYVEEGIKALTSVYKNFGIVSVAVPALGCGLGGLDFDTQVYPLYEKHLAEVEDTTYWLFQPQ
jgi:O-acetyl-ADP-ribose deacetylase (regulator of RNase III)